MKQQKQLLSNILKQAVILELSAWISMESVSFPPLDWLQQFHVLLLLGSFTSSWFLYASRCDLISLNRCLNEILCETLYFPWTGQLLRDQSTLEVSRNFVPNLKRSLRKLNPWNASRAKPNLTSLKEMTEPGLAAAWIPPQKFLLEKLCHHSLAQAWNKASAELGLNLELFESHNKKTQIILYQWHESVPLLGELNPSSGDWWEFLEPVVKPWRNSLSSKSLCWILMDHTENIR